MKNYEVVWLLLIILTTPAWARKHERNNELCSVQSVFVSGNSEAATAVRKELEKRTWLKLENDEAKADAKFTIAEQRISQEAILGGQAITVSGEIMRGSKLLWSRSDGGAGSLSGVDAEAVSWALLRHLNKEASCK